MKKTKNIQEPPTGGLLDIIIEEERKEAEANQDTVNAPANRGKKQWNLRTSFIPNRRARTRYKRESLHAIEQKLVRYARATHSVISLNIYDIDEKNPHIFNFDGATGTTSDSLARPATVPSNAIISDSDE